jgi:hypothetical protein
MTLQDAPAAAGHPEPASGIPTTFSPVTVHNQDTIGATYLGLIAIMLLAAFLRSEARNRELVKKLAAVLPTALPVAK